MMQTSPTPKPESAATPMPVFYRRPELLSSQQHAGKSLAPRSDHRFARGTNSVPLNGVEFGLAQRHYPIVFSDEPAPFPMAVLGLRDAENLFLGASGTWEEHVYVPAYVRRYPFIFMTGDDEKQFALCIDGDSGYIVDGDSNPFFHGDEPTEITKNALAFCASFQAEYEKTRAFAAALTENGLLDRRTADIGMADGQKLVFGPFRVVDEARLGALSGTILADFMRNGWLAWIYAHLLSSANWAALANRTKAPG